MDLSIKEIAIILLKAIADEHAKDPLESAVLMSKLRILDEFKMHETKLDDAALYLETLGLINLDQTDDLKVYHVQITLKGKIYLEENELTTTELFFNLRDLETKLLNYSKPIEKVEYLQELQNYYTKIIYYYTDDDLEQLIKQLKLEDKYKRIKYSPWSDFDHSHISKSEFTTFLRDLQQISHYLGPAISLEKQNHEKWLEENMKNVMDYDLKRISNFCDLINDYNKEVLYLEFVLKEHIVKYPSIFPTDARKQRFGIEKEIEFRKKKWEINTGNIEVKKSITEENNKHNNETEMKPIYAKIQWRGDDTELYYLLEKLEELGHLTAIDKENFLKIVEEYFLDKKGKPFKDKDIQQGMDNLKYTNKSNKPRNAYKIDKIIDDLSNNPTE